MRLAVEGVSAVGMGVWWWNGVKYGGFKKGENFNWIRVGDDD